MAMAYDNTTRGTGTAVTTKTLAHTATGTALAAVVFLHKYGAISALTCTYNGVAMTLAKSQDGDPDIDALSGIRLFALGGVPSGAKDVVAAWTGAANIVMGVMTFSGAASGENPLRGIGGSYGVSSGSIHLSETISSIVGEFCVDGMKSSEGPNEMTPDGGQTEVYDLSGGAAAAGAGSYKAASAGTTAMGYTTGGAFQNAVHVAATVRLPAAGNQVIFAMFKQWQDLYDRIRRGLPLPEWYLRRDRPAWAAAYKLALRGCYGS
jgi:hypothetical protein